MVQFRIQLKRHVPVLVVPCGFLSQNPQACRGQCHCLWCSGRRRRWVEAGGFWPSPPPLVLASSPTPPGSLALNTRDIKCVLN